MTLATKLLDAGWREVEVLGSEAKHAAEKLLSLPGQAASTIRVEADSPEALNDAVELRQSQLAGREDGEIKDVVTNDGTLVTDAQHTTLRADGVSVDGAEKVSDPIPNEDEAKQVAGLESGGFDPSTPYDPTEGSVDAPQVPSDAADKGLSPEAVSASETGSGSADVSTDPSEQAMPASFPPPEGAELDHPVDQAATNVGDNAGQSLEDALADAAPSDGAESQSTPSDEGVNATPAAVEHAEATGVDLSEVDGSGKDGRVTKPDVEAAASEQE